MTASVCIVTPSLNQGRFIERTVQSVLQQDIATLDYIVIDGGSTDETVDILHRYTDRIRWVSEPDKGQADAVNKGIMTTNAEVIGWLNSDDIYYPETIIRVLDIFNRYPDVDIVYGMADHIDTDDTPFEAYPTEEWNRQRLHQTCFICQPATFFRRRVIERCGALDISLHYCMDYEYWLRLAEAGFIFHYLKEKIAGSRLYPDNKTLSAVIPVHREINNMFRQRFGRVPDAWLYNYAYVVTRKHINQQRHPVRFEKETSIRALMASLRWNQRISRSLLHRLYPRWIKPPPIAKP